MGFGKPKVVYQQAPAVQAEADLNKGATDAQKAKKQLERDYGATMQATKPKFDFNNALLSDTTLSSGSLLSLGSKLG